MQCWRSSEIVKTKKWYALQCHMCEKIQEELEHSFGMECSSPKKSSLMHLQLTAIPAMIENPLGWIGRIDPGETTTDLRERKMKK